MFTFVLRTFFIPVKSLEAGVSEQEFGIIMKTGVFMAASLTYGKNRSEPILSKIEFVGKTPEELIKKLNSAIITSDLTSLLLLVLSGMLGTVMLLTFAKLQQDRRLNRLHTLANNATGGQSAINGAMIGKDDMIVVDEYGCSLCKNEARCIVFLPCKHVLYCAGCFDKLKDAPQCGKCGKVINSHVKLFLT